MQRVPLNRLLNQPTVQLKWLEQHQSLEFDIPASLQQRFLQLWPDVAKIGLARFVQQPQAQDYQLYNDDLLFALLAGADYILARQPSFTAQLSDSYLIWTI